MGLDAGTLVAALVVVCTVLAGLLALTWKQNRSVPAFGAWMFCFILCAVAAAILGARDRLPVLLAVDIANTFRLLAYGLAWQGARYFTGQKANWPLTLAPSLLWIAAFWLILPNGDVRARILVAAPMAAAYAYAMAAELWRGAPRRWGIMRLAATVAAMQGTVLLARFVFAALMQESSSRADFSIAAPLHPINMLEAIAAAVAFAFLLLSITKEAIGEQHKEAALRDPLTGVSNRRGFSDEVGRILARAARNGSWTALVLIDLDRFKAVNDAWGHPAGDRLLKALTETALAVMRPGDVLGRLGGDEFAIALADSRIDQALVLAERARRAVDAMKIESAGGEIRFTVSIGVASRRGAHSLDSLFSEADAALYRAKASGGNRVEFSSQPRSDGERDTLRDRERVRRVA